MFLLSLHGSIEFSEQMSGSCIKTQCRFCAQTAEGLISNTTPLALDVSLL